MRRILPTLVVAMALVAAGLAQPAGTPAAPAPNALFRADAVTSVNLTFTAAEFAGLAPKQGSPGGGDESWLQGPEGRRNGLSAARGIEFPYVHADATIDGRPIANIGVRYKGNGTFTLGQRVGKVSLKLDFNQFVKGQRLLGQKTINLHSNVTDASYMNEAVAFSLFRSAGVLAPRTAYARVFINVPGKQMNAPYGLFTIVENPDEPFMEARGLPAAGAIFKPVTTSLFRDLGKDWARYNQTYDPKTDLTPAQKQRVIDFAGVVTHARDSEFAAQAGNYLDLDNVARFLAVTTWLSDVDGILGSGQNYYLYLDPRTNRFSFAAWDQDHSFGQFFRGTQREREQLSIQRPWNGQNRFLERLYAVPAFKTKYIAYLRELNRTLFQPAAIAAEVDRLAILIRPAIRAESAERLTRFEQAVAGQRPRVDDPMFSGANTPIKPFVVARSASVTEQLSRVP